MVRAAFVMAFAFVAMSGLCAAAPASSGQTPLLDGLVKRWAGIDDFTATIVAHEVDGDRVDDRTMRFWFRKPDRAKLEMTAGGPNGSVLVWRGGSQARVELGGLSLFPPSFDVHSGAITSIRGNTMLRPDLTSTLACFVAHRDAVKEGTGPAIGGHATQTLTLDIPGGLGCPGDPPADHDVSRDVLTIRTDDGLVVLRERFVGASVVEHWELHDLRVNVGLTDDDFR
jgi:hypothetical protein